MFLKSYLEAFISLFFPDLCAACSGLLADGERILCTACHADLPFTDHHRYAENAVAKQLWGRVQVKDAMALLFFEKGGKVQQLIHHLKYKGRGEVGVMLGRLMGRKLCSIDNYNDLAFIIPVPLHPKRERDRGYNQSMLLATGVGAELHVPVSDDILIRGKKTGSQTKRSRFSRYENMLEVFEVKRPETVEGLHVLLVDDVLTTGATLEACAVKLLDAGVASVSIAVAAYKQ